MRVMSFGDAFKVPAGHFDAGCGYSCDGTQTGHLGIEFNC
jgi:hypothetical protein